MPSDCHPAEADAALARSAETLKYAVSRMQVGKGRA